MNNNHQAKGRILGYVYCVTCGLVYLKNDISQRRIKAACDPEVQAAILKRNRGV